MNCDDFESLVMIVRKLEYNDGCVFVCMWVCQGTKPNKFLINSIHRLTLNVLHAFLFESQKRASCPGVEVVIRIFDLRKSELQVEEKIGLIGHTALYLYTSLSSFFFSFLFPLPTVPLYSEHECSFCQVCSYIS